MEHEELSVGVDMGGTSLKVAVVRGSEILHRSDAINTRECNTPKELTERLGTCLRELRAEFPSIRAVGMGLPGFVDHAAGIADSLTNVPGWYDVPIRRILEEAGGLPASVDNDANCMAYAEWKLGAARNMQHVVCLTLGTGVGAGVVANGHLLRGFSCAAGEIGQVSIDYRGRIGHYGNRGAVEDYIGNNELACEARMMYAAAGVAPPESFSPIHLERAARSGCPVASALWDDAARKLATCLLNCHYILNPQAFVIGGGIAKAGDLLFVPLRRYLQAQIYPPHFARLQILRAQFGSDAGIIGAARLALDELPSHP